MNTFKKFTIVTLSISLLFSAPAHAGFSELYAQAGLAAQNLWAKRSAITNVLPTISMPKLSMPTVKMPAIALPAVSLPKMSMPSMPKVSLPSRAQVEAGIETVANCLQKAEKVMAQYPTTVAATKFAAIAVPVTVVGGCLAKKAYDKYNQIKQSSMLTPENVRKEMIAQLDADLMGGAMVTAVKVLQETQAYIKELVDQKADKVPGSLQFERDLSRYINIFPNVFGDLNTEWNTFVRLAIAHDNAKDNHFAEDLLASFDRLITQLHELNALFFHEQVEQINNRVEQVNNLAEPAQAEVAQDNMLLVKRVIGG